MTSQRIENLTAVLLVSQHPERLAAFYRDVLGVPLLEDGEGGSKRWACALGDLHLSIHPPADFDDPSVGVGAIRIGLAVKDVDDTAAALEARGVELSFSPRDVGWGKMTAIHDPDGNYLELIELGDDWYRHLDKDSPPVTWPRRRKLKPIDS